MSVVFSVQFPKGIASGAYVFSVTFDGNTMDHTFYINSGPDSLPVTVAANNAYNGAWYDPLLDGEGYNIVTTDSGTGIYFYGSDINGNRLWLISDLLPGPIRRGVEIEIDMYESTGGVFGSPVSSARGLSLWGTVEFVFTDCQSGVATLKGTDGEKVSRIVKITGAAGPDHRATGTGHVFLRFQEKRSASLADQRIVQRATARGHGCHFRYV
jgi:hypothetical protein